MEKIITAETFRYFAYCNDAVCKKPIRGIALEFFGLGGASMFWDETDAGKFYGEHGILLIVPYNNPWAWMNRQAVAYTDELVDVMFEKHNLPADTPIVSTGGSMGGLSALVYTAYAKRTPAACVANCPVCDLPYHYTERPDLPRTMYSAFWNYEGTMDEALRETSPLHLARDGKMPDVKYTVFHCTADKAVNKDMHSERFLASMTKRDVTYHIVKDRGHCDLTPEMCEKYRAAVVSAVLK